MEGGREGGREENGMRIMDDEEEEEEGRVWRREMNAGRDRSACIYYLFNLNPFLALSAPAHLLLASCWFQVGALLAFFDRYRLV
jgi:hypothetical protein